MRDAEVFRCALYDRLANYKFESALKFLEESKLEEQDVEVIRYLASQFGNTGWVMGDFSILINGALRSISGYENYLKMENKVVKP